MYLPLFSAKHSNPGKSKKTQTRSIKKEGINKEVMKRQRCEITHCYKVFKFKENYFLQLEQTIINHPWNKDV